jgi:hypothetical protein
MSISTTEFSTVDVINGIGTSTASAATVNTQNGVITTEALTTAAGATYVMTLTSNVIKVGSVVQTSVGNGTNTACGLVPISITPAAGSAVMVLQNVGLTALNGTMKIGFTVFNIV